MATSIQIIRTQSCGLFSTVLMTGRVACQRHIRLVALMVSALACCGGLAFAAEEPADWPEDPISRNGEMERPQETAGAWAAQSPTASMDAAPVFTGLYMWRGRADRDYKPFHQWELRLEAGLTPIEDVRMRIIPLAADLEPITHAIGHWAEIGVLAVGKDIDFSYKLNCPAPSAIHVEVTWDGGEALYMANDGQSLPQPYDPNVDQAQLIVLPPDFQYLKSKKKGGVVFTLVNKGSQSATGVVHTILLKDKDGKVVKEVEHVPTEDGIVAPGFDEEIKVVINKCPPFHNVAIKTRTDDDNKSTWNPGTFLGVPDVEVAQVFAADGVVTAQVRNGLSGAVTGLVVTIELLDAAGQKLDALEMSVGELAAGAEQALEVEHVLPEGIAGWGVGLAFAASATAGEAGDSAAVELEPVVVEGLSLAVRKVHVLDGAVRIDVTVHNQRDADLSNLVATVGLQDSSGAIVSVPVTLDALAADSSFEAGLVAEGLVDVVGLQLTWKTGN